MKLSAGVLAGGKSSRMGQDKALLTINNQCFLEKITKELSVFDEVLLSVASKAEYSGFGLPMFADEHKEIGPIEGIYQIVKHASNEFVFICAADMPFISSSLVSYMAEYISSDYDCYVIMDEEHIHPLCAIYSWAVLPVIEKLIADDRRRLLDILNNVRTKYIKLETSCFDKRIVKNINTRDEYVRLIRPAVFCVSGVKNSGKTGLITRLIHEFMSDGYQVGVIKHDGHDYVMDHKGTDTFRFSEAGAVMSSIFSDYRCSVHFTGKKTLEEMIAFAGNECDVIIIEGAKKSLYPKIEVVRREISESMICDENTFICVVTDVVSKDRVKCPVFGLDDVKGIFLCVKKYLGLEL